MTGMCTATVRRTLEAPGWRVMAAMRRLETREGLWEACGFPKAAPCTHGNTQSTIDKNITNRVVRLHLVLFPAGRPFLLPLSEFFLYIDDLYI
jgi:hypothetical protein